MPHMKTVTCVVLLLFATDAAAHFGSFGKSKGRHPKSGGKSNNGKSGYGRSPPSVPAWPWWPWAPSPPSYQAPHFDRVASFPVCLQLDPSCNTDETTAAEIVAATRDGMTLVYTDSPGRRVGLVDITDPAKPEALGTIPMDGEPTSVAIVRGYAVVGVNTGTDFVSVSGRLSVVRVSDRTEVASIPLGGQPDSVAVSPDGRYIAVAIENERDETFGDGRPPQMPGGFVVVVDSSDPNPVNWAALPVVDLTGLPDLFPSDPEPEYVDINSDNILVVTLQENNYLVLVDLATMSVTAHFTAGTENLTLIDTQEESPASISLDGSLIGVKREPDGAAWMGTRYFATANEGDLDGGSRGFSVFDASSGAVVWTSGSELEHLAVRYGHYPDSRSEDEGNEPENVEYAAFGGVGYLFVNSERAGLVFVYDASNPARPVFKQALPAGTGPEGGVAIASRGLLVVASEVDSRGERTRSVLNIYAAAAKAAAAAGPAYPTLTSGDRADGTPIPWGALSGLTADAHNPDLLYAVADSYYGASRIFSIDVAARPARLFSEVEIRDANGVLAGLQTSGPAADDSSFDDVDLAAMINGDGSVNIDPEGIARAADGGFWIASEGAGTLADAAARPVTSLNMLVRTDSAGVITAVATLPAEANARQTRFGFESVAEHAGRVFVAFQRALTGEPNPRIGIYTVATGSWEFVYYPLDAPLSQNGGWVGLSDLEAIGGGRFLVVERDNQGGPDAAIKRLYRIDLGGGYAAGETVEKTLVRDILGDLQATGSPVPEKIEGVARTRSGAVFVVNDNDGVVGNSGQTLLLDLGRLDVDPAAATPAPGNGKSSGKSNGKSSSSKSNGKSSGKSNGKSGSSSKSTGKSSGKSSGGSSGPAPVPVYQPAPPPTYPAFPYWPWYWAPAAPPAATPPYYPGY
ncbi:hypothetical protein DIPPA_26170 [Diplonema papillatum]|nr:hypothetical protein DIPPA_26170 [Diplonema papillatum]|eukprot:gene15029-22940_t